MSNELNLWRFIAYRTRRNQPVMLLLVAESSGSSPGRAGYKMAVGADGELYGSIGGGVMEVNLVEQSRAVLSVPGAMATGFPNSSIKEQVHQKNSPHSSGMICSGKQTVIFRLLTPKYTEIVALIIDTLQNRTTAFLTVTPTQFTVEPPESLTPNEDFRFEKLGEEGFSYRERLGRKNHLYIVGGGHCALALSELMSRMDFYIRLFDDRPGLNTLDKNRFAHEKHIIENYEQVAGLIPSGSNTYVVVMTLGYKSDETVIRQLVRNDYKYFGVLGSKAKMAALLKELMDEGFPPVRLEKINTPIGLPINSRTPEEIAISIAAEIISVKNK